MKLLARSAYLAEKSGSKVTIDIVDQAANELETDRYLTLVRTGPAQMQATMAAVIEAQKQSQKRVVETGQAYDAYVAFCNRADVRPITGRVFGDLIAELNLYSLIRSRIVSRGRYGRTREILLDLPQELIGMIYKTILSNFNLRHKRLDA